jgi:hypothetical protein
MVATARELGYDALEVVRTRDLEEIVPARHDVITCSSRLATDGISFRSRRFRSTSGHLCRSSPSTASRSNA